ncbi:MAG: hypothetical protein ACXABY_03820 [Candidatus Thorarchaeota archaeon]|jgi:muramidase (phage lysozyme)
MRDLNAAYSEAKSLPTEALQSEIQSPSGSIPQWIAMSELEYRGNLGGKDKRPQVTVLDEMMMGLPQQQAPSPLPTQGFAEGGLLYGYSPYNAVDPVSGLPLNINDLAAEMAAVAAKNQYVPQAPPDLQALNSKSGKVQMQHPSKLPGLREPMSFARGGIISLASEEDLSPIERALLRSIYAPESGGRYNVRYPNKTFTGNQHPGIREPIVSGANKGKVSTASGAPQFIESTWNEQKERLGLKDFSPRNQDIAALDLAQRRYLAATGQNLMKTLQSGDPAQLANVGRVLHKTWEGVSGDQFATAFNAHMNGYDPSRDSFIPYNDTPVEDNLPASNGNSNNGLAALLLASSQRKRPPPPPPSQVTPVRYGDENYTQEELEMMRRYG